MTTPVRSRTVASAFEERALRAEALARVAPVAREPLQFAAGLLRVQGEVAAGLEFASSTAPWSGHLSRDIDRTLDGLRSISRFAAQHGPTVLAEEASPRSIESADITRTRLALYWNGERSSGEDYLARAMLRPYVEALRAMSLHPDRARTQGHCPFCGAPPLVACRRAGSDADGATRSLVCALCGLEWTFQRILCPACLESSPDKLPSFSSDPHPTVRIEACETCRRYVKSLDVTHDVRAQPEVDDLVSLSLDLWAIEQGFTRIEPGLAGV